MEIVNEYRSSIWTLFGRQAEWRVSYNAPEGRYVRMLVRARTGSVIDRHRPDVDSVARNFDLYRHHSRHHTERSRSDAEYYREKFLAEKAKLQRQGVRVWMVGTG